MREEGSENSRNSGANRCIGIDPGSRFTGYGIVESVGNRLRHIAHGIVRLPGASPFPERLRIIYEELMVVIEDGRPGSMAVEDVFFAKNVKSALRLGQARGAAILAGVNSGLPIFEYSALQIKQAVVGYGRAGKDQVTMMVRRLFMLPESINPNAADALAAAVCHLNFGSSRMKWEASEKS